ncbi:hypothetical protein TSAR_001319 [Trichomalopsis sarcophagae]|uniref:Uncharacterized protein n=1 Tax=Trichomalopsis sarcophagae TaxID=543379 RepID=A0A232EZG6_9HYME|nr:hypothetical protein TSAR_001319 [Trichomalopsis sarcophagae]
MHYMRCIGEKKSLISKDFDPNKYREEVAHNLFLKSENITNSCLYCSSKDMNGTAKCTVCTRNSHKKCIEKAYLREQKLIEKIQNKKFKTKKIEPKHTIIKSNYPESKHK